MSYNLEWDEFIAKSGRKEWWNSSHVYPFVGKEYPSQCLVAILEKCFENAALNKKLEFISLLDDSFPSLFEKIYQTFLGESLVYWLGDISFLIKESKAQKHLSELFNYQGPHTLIFFINKECHLAKINNFTKINIPDAVDEHFFYQLCSFLDKQSLEKKKELIYTFFAQFKVVTLEKAYFFMNYLEVTSLSSKDDFKKFCKMLFNNESSLFSLSQAFFAKKEAEFFKQWREIADEYPLMFWIHFWSDQLWRAYFVVYFMKQKRMREARSISTRLPFAFIKGLWKYAYEQELIAAYSFLYKMDYSFKNGSHFSSLDFFFVSYFSQSLKNKKEEENLMFPSSKKLK